MSAEVEINGLDIYKHGESAYPLHAYGHGWHDFEAAPDSKINHSKHLPVGRKNRIMSVHPESKS